MASNSSAVVPYSERTHLALQTGAEEVMLSFTQNCSIKKAIMSVPFLVLFYASSLFVPPLIMPLILSVSLYLSYFLVCREAERVIQKRIEEVCRPLLEENVDDYLRADQIESALERLARPGPGLLMTSEQYLEGEWTPLCFEPELRPWMRDELQEHFSEESCPLDWVFVEDGYMFLDHSVLIFTRNTEQKLLRVILPLPSATEELFESAKDGLASGIPQGTHVSAIVEKFSLPSEIIEHMSGSKYLDILRDSCQKPLVQRPPLRFKGVMVKEGVAIATAISIGGEETTLFPSGFLEGLHQTVGELELEETESTAD